jgi:hypothetical protein
MKRNIYSILITVLMLSMIACDTMKEPKEEYSPTFPLSGEWWVTYKIDGKDSLLLGHSKLLVSNTSANVSTEILLNTSNRLFGFAFKSSSDIGAKTFSVTNSVNLTDSSVFKLPVYFNSFSIENGKVLLDAGHSLTGIVTDSIYFELIPSLASKAGLNASTKIVVSGVRRTMFPDDDY